MAFEDTHSHLSGNTAGDRVVRSLRPDPFGLGPVGLAITTPRLEWIEVDDRLCQTLGYSRQALMEKTWAELSHPHDLARYLAHCRWALAGEGDGFSVEHRFLRGDGGVAAVRVSVRCLRSTDGSASYFVAAFEDITRRRRSEREREELIAVLEAQNAELERFTYTVSHDLKSPLITIKAFLGLLEEDFNRGDGEAFRSDARRMERAAEKMELLLHDMLELSRVGRLVELEENVPLEQVVAEALELVHGQLAKRQVALHLDRPLPMVYGDRQRLVEVFQNLVDNAVKYIGPQPQPKIHISATLHDQQVVCRVCDNGMGIEPRYREKVFGLFEKLDPQTTGSGVGLALVKRIVQMHGGRIWIESNGAGSGSAFLFVIPRKRTGDAISVEG